MIGTVRYPILTIAKLLQLQRISKQFIFFLLLHLAEYHLWNIKNAFFPL